MASEIPSSLFPEDENKNLHNINDKKFLGPVGKKALVQPNRICRLPEASLSHNATLHSPIPERIAYYTKESDFIKDKLQELPTLHRPKLEFINAFSRHCQRPRINRQTKVRSKEKTNAQIAEHLGRSGFVVAC
jgi:hypothetical protein